MYSKSPSLVVLIFLFIVCCWGVAVSATAQEVHFQFNPPDDFPAYVSTYKNTQVTDMGALGKRTRVSEGKQKVTTDKTPGGYSVTFMPISIMMTQDGKPREDPILSFIQNITVIYELDVDGQLVKIRGFEGTIEKLKASLPAEFPPTVAALLSEETFINRAAQEWDARIGSYVGMAAEIGDVWAGVDETPLPMGGTMAFYSVTKFAEQVKFNDVDCVRLEFSFNTDAEELKDFMGDMWEDLAEMADMEAAPSVSNTKIAGKGERIIDPATMLIYSETVERTIKMTMAVPGQGEVEMTSVDKREYGYEEIAP
jgi:hypothetical protein